MEAPLSQSARRVVRAALLALAAAAAGCDPHSDLVARRVAPAVPRPDAGGLDAAPEAGLPDAGRDAAPAPPPTCGAVGCASLDTRTSFCASAPGRPSVLLGDGCEPGEAPRFRYAVCTCTDLVTEFPLAVDVLAGVSAGTASVAVNQDLRLGADATIDGTLRVSGRYSPEGSAPPQVSGGVQEDAAQACDCDPARLLDVAALIRARERDNDNASAGLDPASLSEYSGARMLALDCGRYYLPRLAGTGPLRIEARGRLALFVDGNIELGDSLVVTLQDGASAEIYVRGTVRVNGSLELSTSNDGNRVLLAVDTSGNIQLVGPARIDGSLYAPRAELVTESGIELHGALFVRRAALSGGETRVHYAPLPAPDPACAR